MLCCYCSKECKNANSLRNHERVCPKNLHRLYKSYTIGLTPWNKGLTADSDARVKENGAAISRSGKTIGRCVDPEKETARRKKLSAAAKRLGVGGYKENAGRSKKFKVYDSQGNRTTLQSTYEYACFEILCELGITWIRPKALKYGDKNYFADFYLPDFEVWLDPKNAYKATVDREKIAAVISQNQVRLYVLSREQITKEYIARVIQ